MVVLEVLLVFQYRLGLLARWSVGSGESLLLLGKRLLLLLGGRLVLESLIIV